MSTFRLGVLISGSGSNLQALIDAIEGGQLPGVEIALVVSNRPDAPGQQRALRHNLPTIYLPWTKPTRSTANTDVGAQFIAPASTGPNADNVGAQFIAPARTGPGQMSENESQLTALLNLFRVDLIVLAGWMRILSAPFLAQFSLRVINLHPALLPDDGTGDIYLTQDGAQLPVFRGLHAVQQALDAHVPITGSTVHYVTPEVDAGPAICREEVVILPEDTEETLHERIKQVEHRLVVEAVRKLRATHLN